MDPRQLDAFARRLGENPNDTEALNAAYQHGQSDPRGYAVFLEKAGNTAKDPAYAAHWLTEAATVWSVSLQDQHRAARTLMAAVDRDPTSSVASDRLTEMYSEKGDQKSIAALFDRRTKHLERMIETRPDLEEILAQLYAELGQLYQGSLAQPDRAAMAYQRAAKHNPSDAFSIYQARELLKASGRYREALPLFAAEQALIENDPERQFSLYQDEAEVARQVGDTAAVMEALRGALSVDSSDDPSLKQQYGSAVLELLQGGKVVDDADRDRAGDLFTSLAETYDGEHGHAYALCALECQPGNDRAAQLAMYYSAALERLAETAAPVAAYLTENPAGLVADDARRFVTDAVSQGGDPKLLMTISLPADAPADVRAQVELGMARALVKQALTDDAARHYRAVLLVDPASVEAISFLADRLRTKKQYAKLRDLLFAAAEQPLVSSEQKRAWLTEAGHLCEGPLHDVDGAIQASEQLVALDPADEDAADHLEAILDKAEQWEALANLIQSRADADDDLEQKYSRYRRVANLHLEKRAEPVAAAEALAVLAQLQPDDDQTAFEAVDLFCQAEQTDRAIVLLSELVGLTEPGPTRVEYGKRLAKLLEQAGDLGQAGGAYAEAASGSGSQDLWAAAVRCFAAIEAWEQAARSVEEQRAVTHGENERARLCALEAGYLERLGDTEGVIRLLDQSVRLDAQNDAVADQLVELYEQQRRHADLVAILLARASAHPDGDLRMTLRKRAALLSRDVLGDAEGMRVALLDLLEDGEDDEALLLLADEAERGGDLSEAVEFLRRLAVMVDGPDRLAVSLRVAGLLERDGDKQGALDQYLLVLLLDARNVAALSAAARLQVVQGEEQEAAETYAKLLPLVEGPARLEAARKRADLLLKLGKEGDARKAYQVVLSLDADDFEVVEVLRDLCESGEHWEGYVQYQRQLIEVEGDVDEGAAMGLALAAALSGKLGKPEEAMQALAPFAEQHHIACRDEYVRLGDRLGQQREVAEALVAWLATAPRGPSRTTGLRAAYDRFVGVGQAERAIEVGLELVRLRGASDDLARSLETVATEAKHIEALQAAFQILQAELSGPSRAEELVRQAEVLRGAGMEGSEAVSHGELAMTSIDPEDAGPLLARLSALEAEPVAKISVYERQVLRCKSLEERMRALCRGAQVASELSQPEYVKRFFQVAIILVGNGEGLDELRDLVKQLDQESRSQELRAALAEGLSLSGMDVRDGGKSRAAFLSRAASIAYEDLGDVNKAMGWLGDGLVAHVEDDYLDQLLRIGEAEGILNRVDETIGRALEHVSDGPFVRALLRRRYELRTGPLSDEQGASEDLKRLYDLSPSDGEVAEKLEQTYRHSGDHLGLVRLYEDQILRCRDKDLRLELSRKVAHIWQDTLDEPRETADAWRRVLRLDSKDQEAREGLEKAKQGMRRVTVAEVAASEEQARAELEQVHQREEEALRQREVVLLAKAEQIKLRHSNAPALLESERDAEALAEAEDAAAAQDDAVPRDGESGAELGSAGESGTDQPGRSAVGDAVEAKVDRDGSSDSSDDSAVEDVTVRTPGVAELPGGGPSSADQPQEAAAVEAQSAPSASGGDKGPEPASVLALEDTVEPARVAERPVKAPREKSKRARARKKQAGVTPVAAPAAKAVPAVERQVEAELTIVSADTAAARNAPLVDQVTDAVPTPGLEDAESADSAPQSARPGDGAPLDPSSAAEGVEAEAGEVEPPSGTLPEEAPPPPSEPTLSSSGLEEVEEIEELDEPSSPQSVAPPGPPPRPSRAARPDPPRAGNSSLPPPLMPVSNRVAPAPGTVPALQAPPRIPPPPGAVRSSGPPFVPPARVPPPPPGAPGGAGASRRPPPPPPPPGFKKS